MAEGAKTAQQYNLTLCGGRELSPGLLEGHEDDRSLTKATRSLGCTAVWGLKPILSRCMRDPTTPENTEEKEIRARVSFLGLGGN